LKKKTTSRRGSLLALFPFFLFGRALVSYWQALRGGNVKKLEAEGKLDVPYHHEKHKVVARDGTKLTASVWVPAGEGPFPAVIMVHSWALWRIQPNLMHARSFARRGYVVLAYDCRGWGSSRGQVHCAAPDKELCDLEDMIDWLTAPENVLPVDPERLGITGISYGGGHSYLIATRDRRIKAAAPMNGWTDLYFALMPNNSWKFPWNALLLMLGAWAHHFSPGNDLMRWMGTFLKTWDAGFLEGEAEERSAIHFVDEVKCPMFIVHSWNDDLFEPNQILSFYEKLKTPKKLHIANGPHGYDAGRGDYLVRNRIWDDTRRWFDYWLKDEKDNGMDREPAVTYFQPWDKKMATSDDWPPAGFEEVLYFLSGEAAVNAGALGEQAPSNNEPSELLVNNTVSSLQSSGPPVLRPNVINNLPIPGAPFTIAGDSMAFTTEPFSGERVLVGTPRVSIFASSSTRECQLNALLYDVGPKGFSRLVTHCVMTKSEMVAGEVEEFDFELIACAHMFKPGHRARLVLCAADPLYVFPSRVPSRYAVYHTAEYPSSVTLPLGRAGGS
jgi:predicted acyl esterase